MKLTFETNDIDSVELERDHIYVYFTGSFAKLSINFYKGFFLAFLKSKSYKEEEVFDKPETLEETIKEFLDSEVARQLKYS